jgi:mycoredoxin
MTSPVLTVYHATWCPHCQHAIAWLKEKSIPFQLVDIERAEPAVVKKVVDVNGGDDWVVPTMEFNGKWRPGKVFNAVELESDLKKMMG